MKLLFNLCVTLYLINCVNSFFGLRSNDVDDADDGEVSNAIFDYNLFLKSPHSARVDSKSKVETLGGVLKGHIMELKRSTMNQEIDVIFLVDSSTSVGKKNFALEIKFVKKLLSDFTVDVNDTRVSVITFSSRDQVKRHVDYFSDVEKFRNKCSLMDDLAKIEYSGGGTYTLGALLEAKKVLKNARPTANKVIFLLTDGFSNGGDPTVEARILRQAGVKIFTFGIQNGNIVELYDMASAPKNESTYILDSFEEFESLANRALHEDLNIGRYVVEPDRKCNRLCVGRDCCDPLASCKCGTHTGKYECICPPGYYGNGLRGGCQACPASTYKPNDHPGDVRTCVKCPDENHVTEPGSTSIEQCLCKKGYRSFANNGCAVLTCPPLNDPKNGYFVNEKCKNVFNAACGLRCKPGYELRGSSLRICREDGTWSGVDTQCIVKTCPALMKPKNGHMICTTDDFSFNTVCRFTCDTGYKLVGSKKRTCLAIAFWTGINTRCREITCRPLPVVRDGVTYPASCTTGDVPFGTTCTVTCHTGYILLGPYNKQCLPEGVWSPASELSQCIDTAPPFIICPNNIEADCDLNENTATVSSQVPLAVDNSGYLPILTSHPAVMPPEKFPIGTTQVTYIAEDLNKNKAECHFYIVVKDRQKPTVDRCFHPLPLVSADVYTEVTWEEPLFSDNSGQELRIRRSHAPGLFPLGITEVQYIAYDPSGNSNNCTVRINVIPHPCEYPPVPLNGNRTCYEDSQGVVCMFTCRPGYDFAVTPARQYTCAFDNVWEPRDTMPVSDCSVLELSNEIIQPASFTFAGLVACQEKIELTQLEKDFERKISKRINEMCEESLDCSIRELETICRENKVDGVYIVLGREKRSVLHVSRAKRETLDEEHEEYETLNATVTFTYNLAGKVKDNTGAGAPEVSALQQKLLVVFDNIRTTMVKDARRGDLDLEVDGQPLSLQGFDLREAPVFTCETGSVQKGRSCAKCPIGTFFNIVSLECEGCPLGTFQHLAGQVSCLYCPENTSTMEPFAVSQHNCTTLCLPGTFSNMTVEPCETCRRGYYQDRYGQAECERCPKQYITLRRGVMDHNECKEKCSVGYVSKTGVEPCWPCPRGTFQSKPGKSACIKCPGGADTFSDGASDFMQCGIAPSDYPQDVAPPEVSEAPQAELAFDDCFSMPCKNNATCSPAPSGQGFECKCCEGFGGVHCDTEFNECDVNPCLHGGTCEDALGDYLCHCALGYTGKKCETDIDDCSEIVCLNGGVCVDQLDGYTCSCVNGYTGVLCETNIDECVSSPCLNGGTCLDGVGGYRCDCPPGLRGEQCEIDDDDCASGPCKNDATCVDDVDGYTCDCPPGYDGENCEINKDECASGPCAAPATCQDLVNDYKCICPTAKKGRNCDQNIDPNFQLDFPRTASTTDYALTTIKQDLTAVTVCFWMKTDDSTNQGTAFSYANVEGDNVFTLTNYDGWAFYVNGDNRTTIVKANTGQWMHVCVLWSSNRGTWRIYMNGIPSDSGKNLAKGRNIKGGGVFVIGQEQDSLGGDFNSAETFIGKITQLNMWSREFTSAEIDKLRLSCGRQLGNVIAWTDISGNVFGAVRESPTDFCKDCPEPPKFEYGDATWSSLRAGSEVQFSCKVGFNLVGKPTSFCLVTGEWEVEETPPKCARVQCPFPRTPRNGFISEGTDYTFDHRVRFSCNKGYALVGSDTQYCGEFGFWEGDTPTCEAIKCSIPALSENTRVINPSPDNKYNPGTEVHFECSEGNNFYTEHTFVDCNAHGAWDQSIPTCDPQKCGLPPKIEHGTAAFSSGVTDFPVGTFLVYTCEFGFELAKDGPNKDGRISCLPDGSWSVPLPQCTVITCPKPQSVANGNYTYDTLDFLGQVRYTCYPGYEASFKEVIECFETGKWSRDPPKCEPVRCSKPDSILHGSIILPEYGLFTYGVTIQYECNLGYLIVGNTTRTCAQNAKWSGSELVCKPISCGKPKGIDFGQIVGSDFTLNNAISYVCDEGFELIGAAQSTCRETGKWQNDPPVCSKVSCEAPAAVENGFYAGRSYFYQDSVTYECENCYRLVGDDTLTCQSNRKWSVLPPLCEAIKCASPPFVAHAYYANTQNLKLFDIGHKVQYICISGYAISSNSLNPRGEIECINTGFWEANFPECLIISCPQPVAVHNGRPLYEAVTFGSNVTYICDDGYAIDEGLDVLTCEASGKWSGSFPICVAQVCIAPEYVLNGELLYKDLNVGSAIRYACSDGHQLFGEEVRRCLANLSWSGSEPRCIPVECGVPQSVQQGNTTFNETSFQSFVSYVCDKGYYLVGDSIRVCQRNKSWSGNVPTCELVQCDQPSRIISNGRMNGDNFTYGSVVTYECDPGYFIDGVSNSRTCLETGEWDRPIVVCNAVECPRLNVRNGQTSDGLHFLSNMPVAPVVGSVQSTEQLSECCNKGPVNKQQKFSTQSEELQYWQIQYFKGEVEKQEREKQLLDIKLRMLMADEKRREQKVVDDFINGAYFED
ncbi:sushi, von Willebrand factor type A, EGF and pentraxin domain-containing protein 1-like isoform X1 [Dreissena polymorpha]|nr:sushi, von Willebrand factor type A, EGF and pentraxin domain-containing protein 1-like isoform X1 [Dreissena polymorpha]